VHTEGEKFIYYQKGMLLGALVSLIVFQGFNVEFISHSFIVTGNDNKDAKCQVMSVPSVRVGNFDDHVRLHCHWSKITLLKRA
jgi:hypothetical protein